MFQELKSMLVSPMDKKYYTSMIHLFILHPITTLKHYATKTIEEFITKIKRGYSDRKYKVDNKFIQQRLNYFFAKNKKTKKKLEIIQQLLNYIYK